MKVTPPRPTLADAEPATPSSTAERLRWHASRPSSRVQTQYNFLESQSVRPPSDMPMRRGTESVPQRPVGSGVRDTPTAFVALVERARAWANQVLQREEIDQNQVAFLCDQLEGLTLSLDDLERQLKRRDARGLHASAAMKLFYLALALRDEKPAREGGARLNHLRDVAFQIRTALMRSVEASENF